MTQQELGKAKDKDLAASLIAMRRAARMARELAARTDTAITAISTPPMCQWLIPTGSIQMQSRYIAQFPGALLS